MTTCGATGSESCCTSLTVTGGSFHRTYTNSGSGPYDEADPATVSDFRLDKYEVTVGRFRQFVQACAGAGCLPAAGAGKHVHLNGGRGLLDSSSPSPTYEGGWSTRDDARVQPTTAQLLLCSPYSTWTDAAGNHENLPITCVNWYEAYAFCIWDGGFLPSETEWEYAAAGGGLEREYPWGNVAVGTACPGTGCSYAIYDCNYPNGSGPDTCVGVTNIAPVGTASAGAGAYGQLDLAGNVWEWTLDWYAAAYASPCTDCARLAPDPSSNERVDRGGDFYGTNTYLLPPTRHHVPPDSRVAVGFRCARVP